MARLFAAEIDLARAGPYSAGKVPAVAALPSRSARISRTPMANPGSVLVTPARLSRLRLPVPSPFADRAERTDILGGAIPVPLPGATTMLPL